MSYFFPLVLVVAAFLGLAYLVFRKFSHLAMLDVNTLPEVKEGLKKKELLRKRMEKRSQIMGQKILEKSQPFIQKLKEIQLLFRKYVGKVERKILEEKTKERTEVTPEKKVEMEKNLLVILQEASFSLDHKDFEAAEKKYIAAIRIDSVNKEAYYGLGQVYINQKQFTEAEETYKFLNQLSPNDPKILAKLAELAEEKGDIQKAVEYYQECVLLDDGKAAIFYKIYDLLKSIGENDSALEAAKQAVEVEPQNPKYLDNLVEISIMVRNKKLANDTYQSLRMVNPENQKLSALKQRIDEI